MTAVIMKPWTLDEAVRLAEEVVAEAGRDYVYPASHKRQCRLYDDDHSVPQCVYVHEGHPDCIVGRMFAKAGVPVAKLAKLEGSDAVSVYCALTGRSAWCDQGLGTFLDQLQAKQDEGETWGDALDNALSTVDSYLGATGTAESVNPVY